MAENIIIKQAYFTNNQTVINSLNEFFSSGFKTKNFPFLDEDTTIDHVLEKLVTRLNAVDPTWLSDEGKYNGIIETINEGLKGLNPVDGIYQSIVDSNNTTLIEAIDSYLGFKTLQFIADNFQDFGTFVNGIYTFELFTKPSQYTNVMDLFSQPIKLEEIPDLDIEERIYDDAEYVDGLLSNDLITFPESMDEQTETERLNNRQDLMGVEILVDDAVQEAAEINYFVDSKPAHMKYSTKTKKWMVSNEFGRVVNDIVSGLRKCDTSEDLQKFFSDPFWKKTTTIDVCKVVAPYILVKALTNPKKSSSKVDGKKYTDSYASIIKQNKGAKRFQNYDLFSTFKSDKEGTIKFIEDFMKLNLVNDPNVYISNNTLLTLFNIFDSRIYLDLVYNITPEDVRDGKTEDQFVKDIRGRINKNSRTKTAYSKEDTTVAPETDDAKQVQEFVSRELEKLGDMSISDMIHCEHFRDLVQSDIDNVDNAMYNAGLSQFLVEEYIGESFYDINMFMDGVFQEADIRQKRETMQQGICSLMANMEEIVKMDKEHRWNANTLGSRYTQSINPWMFLGITAGSLNNSSEAHTNIKQVYHSTRKAMKGKRGNFTQEQIQTLTQLNELTGKLWGCVKMFWINPRNLLKEFNLFKNDKTQKRTRMIADIARQIVALKPKLKFVMDNDNFVNEAWYDGSPDYIFQEATTEDNRKRLAKAIDLVMRDMKEVKALVEKNQWTNAAAKSKFKTLLSTFAGRTEQYCNVKECIKYLERAKAKAAGALTDNEQRVILDLLTKLKEIQKCARRLGVTGMEIGANIKESPSTHKIGQLASEIVAMESEFAFVKEAPKKDVPEAEGSSDEKKEDEVKTESFEYDIDRFAVIMEQETGEIPEYMKTRLKMSDEIGGTITPAGIPSGVPQNPIPDLADSIDTKVNSGGDTLGDMLGSGFENNPNKPTGDDKGKIVVNVTNNYNNSFNRDSNNTTTNTTTTDDHSQGKVTTTNTSNTNSNNNSSHDNKTDESSNKTIKKTSTNKDSKTSTYSTNSSGSNNNNNSNGYVDTKDSTVSKDNKQKLSSGMSIQEMFMFLESEEPQSTNAYATPPKEDLLTKAMDNDRKTLAAQQKAKKGITSAANTGKAVLKPVTRTKQWLTKVVDSLIKRDEDKVKAELLENDSYRSIVFKAARLSLKLGLTAIFFSIQPYLGMTFVAIEGLRMADKHRLKKEMGREMSAELDIINEKIKDLESIDTVEARKQKYEYMRMKKKTEGYFIRSLGSGYLTHPKDA